MNRTHLGIIAVVTLGGLSAVGCGDDTAAGGGGAAATTSTVTGATTTHASTTTTAATGATTTATASTASGASTSTGGQDCSTLATKAECQNCCGTNNPDGAQILFQHVADTCGCVDTGPCYDDCQSEAYCSDGTSDIGTVCEACIGGLTSSDSCTTPAIAACQSDAQCVAALACFGGCAALP